MKRNKHIIIDICNTDGDIERVVAAKSYSEFDYKEIKSLKNGDLWRFPKRVPNKFRKESKKGKRLW
jgi:ribosomal protein RSM22 (predicted rRNA methylase)